MCVFYVMHVCRNCRETKLKELSFNAKNERKKSDSERKKDEEREREKVSEKKIIMKYSFCKLHVLLPDQSGELFLLSRPGVWYGSANINCTIPATKNHGSIPQVYHWCWRVHSQFCFPSSFIWEQMHTMMTPSERSTLLFR